MAQPAAGLVQATNGDFYGTTGAGGASVLCCGTVFKITPSGTLTTLYSFPGGPAGPSALIQATDGDFWGTLSEDAGSPPPLRRFRPVPYRHFVEVCIIVGTDCGGRFLRFRHVSYFRG